MTFITPKNPAKPLFWKEYRALSRSEPAFVGLLLADCCLLLSELMMLVIVPWWVAKAGGATSLAIYSAAVAIVAFLSVPLASPFGDRYCKVMQMRYGAAVLLVTAATLACFTAFLQFRLVPVIAIGSLLMAATRFAEQAQWAAIADLVSPERLTLAIRIRKTCHAASGVLGPLLAGLALSLTGVAGALIAYAAMLGLALSFSLRLPVRKMRNRADDRIALWWRELKEGLSAKWHMPMERGWTIVNFVVWIFQGPAVGILIPIKIQSLGMSGSWLGASLGALSFGVLLGSAFGAQWLVDRFGRYQVRIGVGCLEGICLVIVGFASSPWIMLCALAAGGFCNAAMSLVGATHRMLAVPQNYRIRLSAASAMTTEIAGVIGPALAGMALAWWSVNTVYAGFGVLMALCVLGLTLVPRFKEFLTLDHADASDWYAKQYPTLFAKAMPPDGGRMQ